jgi:phosphomevalonate kinase
MIRASAPGKLFLFGEYAVLEGHPAMIAAVDRRVNVEVEAAPTYLIESALFAPTDSLALDGPASRVAAGILAAQDLGAPATPVRVRVDSSALFDGERKLGFGSSAAVVVAVAGAVLGSPHPDMFAACKRRHNDAQKTEGSGGDIAASLMGGIAWLRPGPLLGSVAWQPPVVIITHPSSASTPAFVSNVKRLQESDPAIYHRHINALGALSEDALRAAAAADTAAFIACVRAADLALDALGTASNTPIVTDFHRSLRRYGAVKPAGAGGGDLSLLASEDIEGALAALRTDGIAAEALKISSGLTIYGG